MNFYLFCGCAASLFGLGQMEKGDRVLFYVKSVKCERYYEGNGIIALLPPRQLIYIGEAYKGYKTIIENWENPRYHSDPLFYHLSHVAEQNSKGRGRAVKGGHAYSMILIGSYTRCDREDSSTIQHSDEEVKITFSDAAGCEAFMKFLLDQHEKYGYGMTLEN